LRELGISIWGKARPTTLIWLAMEDGNRRLLVDANTADDIRGMLESLADSRGMPVFFPLMDLEDQANLKFADVWGNFRSAIERASTRYQTEAILVGRVLRNDRDFWDAHWTLYEGGRSTGWDAKGRLQEILAAGINSSADILAGRYAERISSGTNSVILKVLDILDVNAYAATQRYLRSLGPVKDANAISVEADSVTFRIDIRTDRESLVQALELSNGKQLVPVTMQVPVAPLPQQPGTSPGDAPQLPVKPATGPDLVYRLVR
jgi:hypothetical protein